MVNTSIYTPLYLVHPETARLLKQYGHKIEFDPVVAEAEMRSYRDEFLNKMPLGEETEVTSKIQSVARIRSRDHRLEHLVWTERQTFLDNMKNSIEWTRNYCGMYKIPKVKGKTVADNQGGIKTQYDIIGWITLYEVPWNEANVKKIKELADDQFTLQTYIRTEGSEEEWTIKPDDFDKWAKWEFDALVEYCRFPEKFKGKALSPLTKNPPDMSKNELFTPQIENKNNKTKK